MPLAFLNFSLRRRMEALRPRLCRLARSWCHDASLAEDLTQETLARALSRSSQLRDEQALESWLFSILNNAWRDHLRGRRDHLDVDQLDELVLDETPGPEENYASQQTVVRVRRAIAALPLGQRQVVTLVDLEDFAYAEVAKILDVPVGTVMSRLSRARQALKQHLMVESSSATPLLRRVK